jgi:hypothetical protein
MAVSRDFAEAYLQMRFPNHGGLTPAALVERAFVHRKNRHFSATEHRAIRRASTAQP